MLAASQFPRIVHQTARTERLPAFIQSCISSIRVLNTSWEHRFYTDQAWPNVFNSYPPFDWSSLFKYPSGIQRSDIFRCVALYQYGGLYADVDMLGIRPIESLITNMVESGLIASDTEVVLTTDH